MSLRIAPLLQVALIPEQFASMVFVQALTRNASIVAEIINNELHNKTPPHQRWNGKYQEPTWQS